MPHRSGHHSSGGGIVARRAAILDKFVEVTGGKEAYGKLQNRVTKGTYELVGMDIVGNTLVYQARPSKRYYRFEADAFGTLEHGTDGDVVWEKNKRELRMKDGEDRLAALHEAFFDSVADWRKLYKKAECVGIADVDGKPCYKVVLTPAEVKQPRTHYFDKQSNLLVKTETQVDDSRGEFLMETYPSEYKPVDGILIPFRSRVTVADSQRLSVTDSVEHNVNIPDNQFKMPEDSKAGEKKEKDEPAKPEEKPPDD